MEREDVLRITITGSIIAVMVGAVIGAAFILSSMKEGDGELVIYCYDSFVSWGLGPEVEIAFEALYGVNITIVKCGDVGGLIGRLDAEKKDPRADIAVGIDNSMLHIALDRDLLDKYEPSNIGLANASLIFDPEFHVVPFDYGYIAMICNGSAMREAGLPFPDSIMDLDDPIYEGRIMLIDPATSSTGSSFLTWAAGVAGDGLRDYLEGLADNANGRVVGTWDAMYTAFISGEVEMAISYGLDTASEMIWFGTNNTVTIVPKDEGYRQIEGVGIVKGARNRELAEKFVEFCLEPEFQTKVGKNVMLPVVPATVVDPIFVQQGAFGKVHVEPTQATISSEYGTWLDEWDRSFV